MCGSFCCYFTVFFNYVYLRMDKCVEIGRFYGDCSIFADGILMIFPLLTISFLIILFLKIKGELKICNVPLTSVKNFDICELKRPEQPIDNNQSIEMIG